VSQSGRLIRRRLSECRKWFGNSTLTPVQEVDLTASLDKLAASAGEKLDWRKSIVDLMKRVVVAGPPADVARFAKSRTAPYLAKYQSSG
jgi:hypothetical protein